MGNGRQAVYFYYFDSQSLLAWSCSLSPGVGCNQKGVNVSLGIIWLEASVCVSRAAHSACVTSAELDWKAAPLFGLMWREKKLGWSKQAERGCGGLGGGVAEKGSNIHVQAFTGKMEITPKWAWHIHHLPYGASKSNTIELDLETSTLKE